MIDEKIIIKKIENRIDAFVKEYPEKKRWFRSTDIKRIYTYIAD